MEAVRTHDKLYLKENRKLSPKESFKFIYSHSKKFIQGIENPRILDIGCATGDFLYYLSTKFPNAKLMGMDLMPDLIEVARKEVPKCEFILGNIQEDSQFQAEKFDAIFMVGVHPIFDECQPWIKNIISQLLKKMGRLLYLALLTLTMLISLFEPVGQKIRDPGNWVGIHFQ